MPVPSRKKSPSGAAGDILIVEDNAANLLALEAILVEAGYRVRTAPDGESALKAVQSAQPALILLDVGMPGMDGFQVCRRLHGDPCTRDIPVVFLSAFTAPGEKAHGFDLGAVDYIAKPFDAREVLARIRAHIALSTARAQLRTRNVELHETNRQLTHEIAERRSAEEALAAALARLQALTERLTQAREEERSRIAFELHERSGQELSTLKLHLQMLESHCRGKDAQARLRDARTMADLALERVRAMSLDLHPPQLDDLGLYAALGAHCRQQAQAAGWLMHIDIPQAAQRPSREVELACFRVVQEALANVARHAKATEVWLTLRKSGEQLQLSLRDNGLGFDASAIYERIEYGRFGLIGVKERLRQLGGRLEIKSRPGMGTELNACFPQAASVE
jgi:signal transduction histidine kinase